ncbi:MAG: hemolysin III family protein [Alkalispirochaeta sp.]
MNWLDRHISLHGQDSPREERANWITHMIGAVLAVMGTVALLLRPERAADTFSLVVFGASMIVLFYASTAYHLSPAQSSWKRLFRLSDHVSIYLLIAGTYTPIMKAIGTSWAHWTLTAVWTLAAVGITLKVILWDRFRKSQVVFFLAMGWLAVVRLDVLLGALPQPFFVLLLTGGLFYSVGTILYSLKKMPYHHAIWHLFVLGGAGSLFWGVYEYI